MENISQLAGRQWLSSQMDCSIKEGLTKTRAIKHGHCLRCGARVYAKLPNGKKYCRACIGLGRIVADDFLIRNEQTIKFRAKENGGLTWKGQLTNSQTRIARNLIRNYIAKRDSLVHAVTGAGKTEMLFPLVAYSLKNGERCCIATPRIDVVNELYPRFKAAFDEIKIGKYHGREYQEPEADQLTLCTTHQLLKYFHAFDLLIIDESDSFPYVNNSMLHFAAQNAIKLTGKRVFLTATPTADLLSSVKAGKIHLLKLKRRFHGQPLPVPKEKLFLRPFLRDQKINSHLTAEIIKVIQAGHPLLLFVPRINQIGPYIVALKKIPELAEIKIAGVHANDAERIAKVDQFRSGQIQLLVTTTILERGVTFNHVWVIVVQADDKIYTSSSLVQIAGRVGRAKNDPEGLVLFCYQKYTSCIRTAMKQIRGMNQ